MTHYRDFLQHQACIYLQTFGKEKQECHLFPYRLSGNHFLDTFLSAVSFFFCPHVLYEQWTNVKFQSVQASQDLLENLALTQVRINYC